jgi:hypothetical protein
MVDQGKFSGQVAWITGGPPASGRRPLNCLPPRGPGLSCTLGYSHFTRVGIFDRAVEPLPQHASYFHGRGSCKGALQASFVDNQSAMIRFRDYLRSLKLSITPSLYDGARMMSVYSREAL